MRASLRRGASARQPWHMMTVARVLPRRTSALGSWLRRPVVAVSLALALLVSMPCLASAAAGTGPRLSLTSPQVALVGSHVVVLGRLQDTSEAFTVVLQRRAGARWLSTRRRVFVRGSRRFSLLLTAPQRPGAAWLRAAAFRGRQLVATSKLIRIVYRRNFRDIAARRGSFVIDPADVVYLSGSPSGSRTVVITGAGRRPSVGNVVIVPTSTSIRAVCLLGLLRYGTAIGTDLRWGRLRLCRWPLRTRAST